MNKTLGRFAGLLAVVAIPACVGAPTVTTVREPGQGVSWCRATSRIAYFALGTEGYFRIRLMNPDGSDDRPLFESWPAGLPRRHQGTADWHPSGKYLLFTAEKETHPGGSEWSIPGRGAYNDLWAATADGRSVFPLTSLPVDVGRGVIIPHFSRDGRRVAWSELVGTINLWDPRLQFGSFVMKVADWEEGWFGPRLTNIRTYRPGPEGFYETYGFTPDGSGLIFCSSLATANVWSSQIFTLDLATGALTRQLTKDAYNEHAYYSLDGSKIVWMSTLQSTLGGADWWIMNADGTGKARLTFFNEPGDPTSSGQAVWCGDTAWFPDGRGFLGSVQTDLVGGSGKIVKVSMN
jgi:hypothetical protein